MAFIKFLDKIMKPLIPFMNWLEEKLRKEK